MGGRQSQLFVYNLFNGARSSKTENNEELKAILIYFRGEVSSAEKYGGYKQHERPFRTNTARSVQ
jgi:hypothetical protein